MSVSVEKVELRCRQCGYRALVRGRPPSCPICRAGSWEPTTRPIVALVDDAVTPDAARPDWPAVERLLTRLAETRVTFATATSTASWISSYEPERRIRLETDIQSSWVEIDDIRACWETFERLGRIRRRDVLEPGRCSAFVMALFEQVAGVRVLTADEAYLVLPR